MATKSGITSSSDIRHGVTVWFVEVCISTLYRWSARAPKMLRVVSKAQLQFNTVTDHVEKVIYVANQSYFMVATPDGQEQVQRFDFLGAFEEPPTAFPKDRLFVSYRAAKKYADQINQQSDPFRKYPPIEGVEHRSWHSRQKRKLLARTKQTT